MRNTDNPMTFMARNPLILGTIGFALLAASAIAAIFNLAFSLIYSVFLAGITVFITAGFLFVRSTLASNLRQQRKWQAAESKKIDRQLGQISESLQSTANNLALLESQLTKSIGKTNRNVTSTRKAIDEKLAQGSLEQISTASFQLALSQRRMEHELTSLLSQKESQ